MAILPEREKRRNTLNKGQGNKVEIAYEGECKEQEKQIKEAQKLEFKK
jgi:hypothetical protein